MHTVHSQWQTVHTSTAYVMHSCEHKHIPHTPGAHVSRICTHSSHRRLHDEKRYRRLPTLCTPHTLDTDKYTTHTGTQNPLTEGVPGTQAQALHLHTHSHITYTAWRTHPRTHTRPHTRPDPQSSLSTRSSLSLLPSPPLPTPVHRATSALSPDWGEHSRRSLLTVFCASSLPFSCFLGWRS